MGGFRTPEIARAQIVLWEHRLEDALPHDHQTRHLDFLLGSAAFADTFPDRAVRPPRERPAGRLDLNSTGAQAERRKRAAQWRRRATKFAGRKVIPTAW